MTKSTYLKTIGIVVALGFSITLAVLIGDRLSTQAIAVLAGAACGVGAAIPTSLLIIAVTQQRRVHQPEPTPGLAAQAGPRPQFTPPMFISPVQIQQPPAATPPPATWAEMPQRHFTVVGDLSAQAGMGEEE